MLGKLFTVMKSTSIFFKQKISSCWQKALILTGFAEPLHLSQKYSVIIAAYNAEKYLDQLFTSLAGQSVNLTESLEIICVDDGSTDASSMIIEKWRKKYPDNIIYIHKENGGVASARNLGIEHATCAWVTFIDADDFIHCNYFERVDKMISHPDSMNLRLVCTYTKLFQEAMQTITDSHPLRDLYKGRRRRISVRDPGTFIVLTVRNCFYLRDVLNKNAIRQKEDITPNFEDSEMNMMYLLALLAIQDAQIGIVPNAFYFGRKRQDCSSLINTAQGKADYYTTAIKNGCTRPLRHALDTLGSVPEFMQRMVLLELKTKLDYLIEKKRNLERISSGLTVACMCALREVFQYIGVEQIVNFTALSYPYRIGVLYAFKQISMPRVIDVTEYDDGKKMSQFIYYSTVPYRDCTFYINGLEVEPEFKKIRAISLLGENFVYQHRLWIAHSADRVTLHVLSPSGDKIQLIVKGKRYDTLFFKSLKKAFSVSTNRSSLPRHLPFCVWLLRKIAFFSYFTKKYREVWLFLDTDNMADGNSTWLYRYVTKYHPELNCRFLLRSSAQEWKARKREGFKLINFASWQRLIAMVHCKVLIASYADEYLLHMPKLWKDLQSYKIAFVQHGVFKSDMSCWVNTIGFSFITATTQAEYKSLVDDFTGYAATAKEVALTGLPRHDALFADSKPERTILIMPTWRNYLLGSKIPKTQLREPNPEFMNSAYLNAWKNVLHSERLRILLETYSYRLLFYLHRHMQQYLELFEVPSHIQTMKQTELDSIDNLFKRSRVFITDYSSAAFEWGLMRRSIMYYQFDHETFLAEGNAGSVSGYFEYERDGFGPVAYDESTLLDYLEQSLHNDGTPSCQYLNRINATFTYHDANNCERVFEAVQDMFIPYRQNTADGSPSTATKTASAFKHTSGME